MSDLRTSLLVNRQVPEFIREEYPLFISFFLFLEKRLKKYRGISLLNNFLNFLNDKSDASKEIKS